MDSAATEEPEWMARLRSNREAAQGLASPATADPDGKRGDGPTTTQTESSYSPRVTLPEMKPKRIIADGYGRTVADSIARAARQVGKRYGLDEQQVRLLTRVAQGWEYVAIARQLDYYEAEVTQRVGRIRARTGTASRYELTRLVFEEVV